MKRLAVTADDFGLTLAVNEAVVRGYIQRGELFRDTAAAKLGL